LNATASPIYRDSVLEGTLLKRKTEDGDSVLNSVTAVKMAEDTVNLDHSIPVSIIEGNKFNSNLMIE
jgi:hypothetical protein